MRDRNDDNDDVVDDDVWLARRKLLSYELRFWVIFWEKNWKCLASKDTSQSSHW